MNYNKSIQYLPLLGVTCSLLANTSCKQVKNNPPNIIYINIDDLGWKDCGTYGNPFFKTPNIDKLAKQGLLFTNAYATAANCAPSRACLLSGKYPQYHGIYTVGTSERGKSKDRQLIPIENKTVLDTSFVLFPELLQKAGYYNASIGKWHLDDDPCQHGFDINIAGTHAGHPKSYFSPYNNAALGDGEEGEYLTDRLTSEAISFIRQNRNGPFFLYLPYFTVHTPLQAKDSLVESYKSISGINATYAAMIENMDINIGRIIKTLDDEGLNKNTVLIFTSDNGGICAISSQAPLRAGKGSYYEGGIRVPLIIRWPEHIEPGGETDYPVSNLDFYPTLLKIAGVDIPEEIHEDGIDISPLFENPAMQLKERPIFWHFPIYLEAYNRALDDGRDSLFRTRPGSAVRFKQYKLHEYFEDNGIELYDLSNDPGERNNIADTMQKETKDLHQLLINWRNETGAPVPVRKNPEYQKYLIKAF